MPNTYLTPSASRHSTKTSDALRSLTTPPYLTDLSTRLTAAGAAVDPARLRALLAAAVLLTGFTAAARAGSVFYIRGGGDGHGIGMSQYGAYGYALHGADYHDDPGPLLPGHRAGRHRPAGRPSGSCSRPGSASFSGAGSVSGRTTRLTPGTTYTVSAGRRPS